MSSNRLFLMEAEEYLEYQPPRVDFGRAIIRPPIPSTLARALNTHSSSQDWVNYGPWEGIESLRERIAEIHSPYRDGGISGEQVIITLGATGARHLYINLKHPRVAVQKPYFFDYSEIPNFVPVRQLDDTLEACDAYLTSNPHNPQGSSLTQDQLDHLDQLTCRYAVDLVIDSAYRGFELVQHDYKLPNHTWEFVSVGKSLGMTDLRVGALILPTVDDDTLRLLHEEQNDFIIAVSQHEQKRALEKLQYLDEFQELARAYLHQMSIHFTDKINNLDEVHCVSGGDAGIHFIKYTSGKASKDVAWELLKQEGIYVMPGDDFGVSGHLRISLGNSTLEGIDELVDTLPRYIG